MNELYSLTEEELGTLIYGVLDYYNSKLEYESNQDTLLEERLNFLNKVGYSLEELTCLYQVKQQEETLTAKEIWQENQGFKEFSKKYFTGKKEDLKKFNRVCRQILKAKLKEYNVQTKEEFNKLFYESVNITKALTGIWPDKEPSKKNMIKVLKRGFSKERM